MRITEMLLEDVPQFVKRLEEWGKVDLANMLKKHYICVLSVKFNISFLEMLLVYFARQLPCEVFLELLQNVETEAEKTKNDGGK